MNDACDKNEKPTPKRLKDARKDGNIAKNRDLSQTATTLVWVLIVVGLSGFYVGRIGQLLERSWSSVETLPKAALLELGVVALETLLWLVIAPLALASLVGVLAEFLRVGPLLAFKKIAPRGSHIYPIEGFKRLFAKENFFETGKSIVKTLLLTALLTVLALSSIDDALSLPVRDVSRYAELTQHLLVKLGLWIVAAFGFVSIVDWLFQKHNHEKRLRGQGEHMLPTLADPSAPRLDTQSVSVNDKRVVTLNYARPGKGTAQVTVSNQAATFNLSSPNFIGEGDGKANAASYTVNFAKLDEIADIPEQLLNDLEKALGNADLDNADSSTRAAAELAKGRLAALKDPTFWSDVSECIDDFNIQKLSNGTETSVKSEVPLEMEATSGTVSVNGIGRGSSRRTTGVAFSVTLAGKEHKATLSEDGNAASWGGNNYPIRFDEDSGQWMAVIEHKSMTQDQAKATAIAVEVDQRTAPAVVNALPVETGSNGVELTSLGFVPAKDGTVAENGTISMTYARAEGAVEEVKISNQGISFVTYLPSDLPGQKDANGFNKLSSGLGFKDINSWGQSASEQVRTFRDMLDNVDTRTLTRAQREILDTARARLDLTRDPGFWNTVNTSVASQLDAELPDEGPIAVEEGFEVIIDRDLQADGSTETNFFIDDENGKRVKIEPSANDTVTLAGKEYRIATDINTGDLVVVKKYKTAADVMRATISKEVIAAVNAGKDADAEDSSPLCAIGPHYGLPEGSFPTLEGDGDYDYAHNDGVNEPKPVSAEQFRAALTDLLNDPAAFSQIFNAAFLDVQGQTASTASSKQ